MQQLHCLLRQKCQWADWLLFSTLSPTLAVLAGKGVRDFLLKCNITEVNSRVLEEQVFRLTSMPWGDSTMSFSSAMACSACNSVTVVPVLRMDHTFLVNHFTHFHSEACQTVLLLIQLLVLVVLCAIYAKHKEVCVCVCVCVCLCDGELHSEKTTKCV